MFAVAIYDSISTPIATAQVVRVATKGFNSSASDSQVELPPQAPISSALPI